MKHNSGFGPSTRLPFLPAQLTSLCRNTGLPGVRLKPDNLDIAPAEPKINADCARKRCRPLPVTYTTRRGQLFIYPGSMEVESWHSTVNPKDLAMIAEMRANKSKVTEGEKLRMQRSQEHVKLVGILKQNLAFPQTWISPGRGTVPEFAIDDGQTLAEYLVSHKAKNDSFKNNETKEIYSKSSKEEPVDTILNKHYSWTSAQLQDKATIDAADGAAVNRNNPFIIGSGRMRRKPVVRAVGRKKISKRIHDDCAGIELSRSSLASESLSFLDINWNSSVTENEELAVRTSESDEDSNWTYTSAHESLGDEPVRTGKRNTKFPVIRNRTRGRMLDATYYRAQVNANAVCTDSANRDLSLTPNRERSPSLTTMNTTGTTVGSSRRSRAASNMGRHPLSPSRITPASTPSRKAAPAGLLETAKMLLSESSKLEGVHFPRDPTIRQLLNDQLIGGGDAGTGERAETDRVRAHRERKHQREATELQRQIDALDATIVRLHKRTQEKAVVLQSIAHDTMQQIKVISYQRGQQRRAKQMQKRQITRNLFLRHFRNRQYKRKRLRIKLGLTSVRPTAQVLSVPLPLTLSAKDLDEGEAIRQWEAGEDLRDDAETALASRQETELAMKVTARFRWLRDVTNAQLMHLEEFMRVNRQSEDDALADQSLEQRLPILRAKHCRLVSLLQKYGIASDDRDTEKNVPCLEDENVVPTTIALRQLWSYLDEEKLHKLQRTAVEQFDKATCIAEPKPSGRRHMSPATRQRRLWRVEARQLERHGKALTKRSFSYFEFWPVPSKSSDDEGADREEEIAIENLKKITNLPELESKRASGDKDHRNLMKQLLARTTTR